MAADSALSVGQIKNQFLCNVSRISIEVLFKQLNSTEEGLTSEEGANRLQIFGPNKLEEKKESKILKFLGFMWNPLSCVMEFAAIIAIGMDRSGKTPDWEVFMGIVVLLVINSTISFIEENNAGSMAAALMAGFSPKTKVLRDGRWSEQVAANLVPGDIISIKSGDIVPADARLLNGDQLMMDQSALTGEDCLVKRFPGQVVFSGSTCKQGEGVAVVVATGVHTIFGKAVNLVDSSNQVGHLEKILTTICEFCICCVMIAIIIEIIVMCGIQHRNYTDGINNLLVLMIGGIPIAMPTVLSVTMAIGSHRLSEQGAITKRMTAIEEMAGMDVLCSDKTGTLTLNKPSVDRNRIEVFAEGVDKEHTILLAARASKTENQDVIDSAIVGMLADPMEARAGIREVHFLPFNPIDRRTALTYIDSNGNWHRASKGSLVQIMNLCNCKEDVREKVRVVDDKFAKHGLRSLAVARQEVPERTKESAGAPWQFVGLLPLFDSLRHDSAETIRSALNLGVNVKMITGDRLSIAKETGRRLGMGTNMYRTSDWLNNDDREPLVEIPFIHLIEKADGFAVAFPDQKYEIVRQLQQRKHICGMTGDGVNDAPALKKANFGIAVAGASDAAINASDIILTEPGLSVIISAIMTSRDIFQRMKNYTLGFLLIALIWKFDFSPFMVLITAILNDGTIMTIPRDRVKPSPMPDNWKLREIFVTAVVLGSYLALMTVIFFWAMIDTDFFSDKFGVRSLRKEPCEMMAALYLQVSIVGQALIFVTRSRSWSCAERPGLLLAGGFIAAQLVMSFNLLFKASSYALYVVHGSIGLEKKGTLLTTSPTKTSMAATLIAVYANWGFARIKGVGWGWAGVIWLYSLVSYLPLDLIKFFVRDALNGKAPDVSKGKTAFTSKKDYGREERAIQCPLCKGTLHGLEPLETTNLFSGNNNYLVQAESAEQAKRPVEVVQGFVSCTQGNAESVVEPTGLDN